MTDYIRDLRPAEWGSGVHGSNPEPLMSALGQKQTLRSAARTSSITSSAVNPRGRATSDL